MSSLSPNLTALLSPAEARRALLRFGLRFALVAPSSLVGLAGLFREGWVALLVVASGKGELGAEFVRAPDVTVAGAAAAAAAAAAVAVVAAGAGAEAAAGAAVATVAEAVVVVPAEAADAEPPLVVAGTGGGVS